jgi:hypothetical protein
VDGSWASCREGCLAQALAQSGPTQVTVFGDAAPIDLAALAVDIQTHGR